MPERGGTAARLREAAGGAAERALAGAAVLCLSPLLLGLALLVRLTSPGPVLYRAPRLGRGGRVFQMRKFRSMAHGAPPVVTADSKLVVAERDPRLTPVGRLLRIGFDELPQLLDVAAGHMSFVGPRPDTDWILGRYTPAIRRRLEVRPGITGLAQVLGARELPTAESYALDAWYVGHRSLALDVAVLALTVPYVAGVRAWPRRLFAGALAEARREAAAYELLPGAGAAGAVDRPPPPG